MTTTDKLVSLLCKLEECADKCKYRWAVALDDGDEVLADACKTAGHIYEGVAKALASAMAGGEA